MIGIRADANSIIATGHMMRCMTIARALVMQGQAVTFFVADEESLKLFSSFAKDEFEIVSLGTDYRDMEGELEILQGELKKRHIEALLVDSYSVTADYFKKLSSICRTAYLDDLKSDIYPVDILINYSGYAPEMGYEEAYSHVYGFEKEPTKLLLGLHYAPLRPQFYECEGDSLPGVAEDSQAADHAATPGMANNSGRINVLLSTGGADMCNMIVPVLENVIRSGLNADITWHVVVGDYVSNTPEIEELATSGDNIVLDRSVKNMAQLMRKCDIAVLAAGTMLTECAALRLPAVFYQVADNQKINVRYFGNTGGMIFAGSVMDGDDAKKHTIETIIREINRLSSDERTRNIMKEHLAGVTDGKGAIRISKALAGRDLT